MNPTGLQLCSKSRWVPDDAATQCMICRSNFDLLRRKHHCRICGRVVCANCSRGTVRIGGEDHRWCGDCQTRQAHALVSANIARQMPGSPMGGGTPPPQGQYPPPQPYAQPQGQYPPPQQQQPYYAPPPQGGYPPQQSSSGYYAPPPQQQQPYPPQQPYSPQAQQQQPMPPQPYAADPSASAGVVDLDAGLQNFAMQNEIKPQYLGSLRRLADYDVVVICDDSGSMSLPADPEDPRLSRWAELKTNVAILLKATAAFNKPVDVYFLNRGVFRGVTSYDQLLQPFASPPAGGTNTVRTLRQIWADRNIARGNLERPLIVHLFTDGHPTNDNFNEDIDGFARWMRERPNIRQTFFSILLCTDDEEVCGIYRPLEYRVRGQWGWQGATCGIPGVDVTEDYRGELRDIRALRGGRFPFSMGDYIVKCLVGPIDPAVHAIDLPQGASIYGQQRRSFW